MQLEIGDCKAVIDLRCLGAERNGPECCGRGASATGLTLALVGRTPDFGASS